MQKGEDFNESPYFERVLFRHNLDASKLVYEMSYKQRRFIPKDGLSRLARQIAESNEVTRRAVERCLQMFWRRYASQKGLLSEMITGRWRSSAGRNWRLIGRRGMNLEGLIYR